MLRSEPGIEVTLESGPYGTFQVLSDGEVIVDAGALAFLGVLPSLTEIRTRVEARRAKAGESLQEQDTGGNGAGA